MRPSDSTVILRRDLSAIAQEFDDTVAQLTFVGLRVAPPFVVGEASAKFPILKRGAFKKPAETARAEGAAYNRVTGEFGVGTYTCEEHGLEYPIDDRRRARYRTFFDSEQAATRILRHQILLAHERRVAALTLNNSSFTTTAAGTNWSTAASATPLDELTVGMEALEDRSGTDRSELTLIIPRADYRLLIRTTQVADKMKYSYIGEDGTGVQPNMITEKILAAMLGIKQVLRPRSVYDAAEEGITESNTQVWTAGYWMLALLADGEQAPLEQGQLARTMLWTASAPDLPVVESYRWEPSRADIIRMRDDTDEVLVGELDLFGYRGKSTT